MSRRKPVLGACKDCVPGLGRPRPVTKPGPRCATHQRERRKRLAGERWARHIGLTYGLTVAQYEQILDKQGGVCYICRRARGTTKRLQVDHDHKTGKVRGLLCSPCNRDVIGHLRDDPEACRRAATYLENPPAYPILYER